MTLIKILTVLTLTSGLASAADRWPQFRGLTGQGHAQATDLPVTWSETENVTWKTSIPGKGWSSPVIEAGQIWFTTALEDGRHLHAICVDAKSGQVIHNVPLFEISEPLKINAKNSHASPTPVIEPGRVYVHFGAQGTACLDTASGKVLWKNQELQLDHKEGPGSSPILWNDLFIVNCDGTDVQYVVALDKASGKVVWKVDRPGPVHADPDLRKAYGTPVIVHRDGRDQLISNGAHQVISYDPATGEQLWRLPYEGFSNVPRIVVGPELIYMATGYMKPQMWALRLPVAQGEAPEVVWRAPKQVPSNPSPVLVGARLYMVSDQGVLTCLNAETGKEVWKERVGGTYSSSLLFADGRIYVSSEDGVTTVFQPGDEFQELAKNTLDDGIMASLAVTDRAFILRTATHLYRIETTPARTAKARDVAPVAVTPGT